MKGKIVLTFCSVAMAIAAVGYWQVREAVYFLIFKPPKLDNYRLQLLNQLVDNGSIKLIKDTTTGLDISVMWIQHTPSTDWTILISHGTGDDLANKYDKLIKLSDMTQSNILCYDYNGYGISTGKATEFNLNSNIQTIYNYITNEKKIPSNRIILYGMSLGGGPTLNLASKLLSKQLQPGLDVNKGRNDNQDIDIKDGKPFGAIILQATFLSIPSIVLQNQWLLWILKLLQLDIFDSAQLISELQYDVDFPVLIMHGKLDGVVPFWHAQELYQLFKAKSTDDSLIYHYWDLMGAHLGDLREIDKEKFSQQLLAFVNAVTA